MKLSLLLERDNFMTAEVAKDFGLNRRSSRKKIIRPPYIERVYNPNLISRSLL